MTTERELRERGLSSSSADALAPTARTTIGRLLELAARELCVDDLSPGVSSIAVNLLGDETQLVAALDGPLRPRLEQAGWLDAFRVLPLDKTMCAHVVSSEAGYLDVSDPDDESRALARKLADLTRGALPGYAGVAIEVAGVRVGTLCLHGTENRPSPRRDAREAGLRRYGALLSQGLDEVARLAAENEALRREIRGLGSSAVGEGGVYGDADDAAAWRETVAILGDVEASIGAGEPDGARGVVACVVELRPDAREVAVVAASDGAVERHGLRPCLVRQVGDDDLMGYWRAALAPPSEPRAASGPARPRVHHEQAMASAPAAARLGTSPGAYASMHASPLPDRSGGRAPPRALVVYCVRPPATEADVARRDALLGRVAALVADAQFAALAVFSSRARAAGPATADEPEPAILERVRYAFGKMKLKALLALAEERGVPGAESAESSEEFVRLFALHTTRLARARRVQLDAMPVRELLAIGEKIGAPGVDDWDSKREMIDAILEAEGLRAAPAPAPLPAPLPVPTRARPEPTPEKKVVGLSPDASWLKEAMARAQAAAAAADASGAPAAFRRVVLPENEPRRAEVLERLDLADLRDWSAHELSTFDGVAAGAAAVAGAPFGAVTLVDADEQLLVGTTDPELMRSVLTAGARAQPAGYSFCQFTVAKGAPLGIADTQAPEAAPMALPLRCYGELVAKPFDQLPRSYLGVPMVTSEGVVLGSVCILDHRPRPDFVENPRLVEQLEALARAVVNLFELRRLRGENARLHAHRRLDVAAVEPLVHAARGSAVPVDRVALFSSDIEGSTSMHERDPALMKRALEVHDSILRRAIADNGGVEVATEGDAFTVAFHGAADAIRCAFDAQLRLLAAPWPAGLEALGPSARTDEPTMLRGCRVRMSVHFAEAGGGILGQRAFEVTRHAVTRRPRYRGRFVDEAKFVSEMPSGGQVLVTERAFDDVALVLSTALGDPRVVDLGRYADDALGDLGHVYELLPRTLGGRRFEPPIRLPTGGRLTAPGFIHAPRTTPLVVMFVLPVGATELSQKSDADYVRGLEAFSGAVRAELARHAGYEMKENEGAFMCAFATALDALTFGAAIHGTLAAATEDALRCKAGVCSGEVAIEPHGRTGRLEAYGPACNRAARLAKAANQGQTLADGATARVALGAGLEAPLHTLGEHRFKGVEEPIEVVQVGGGVHPPIQSLSYARDLQGYFGGPLASGVMAAAALGLMDAMGVDEAPVSGERVLGREQARALVRAREAAIGARTTASRLGGA